MATTTNYGWTTPDDTALVKDGAAAIRTLGTSVDTTTKNLNPSTTLGDIEYRSSSANVNTRLAIGSTGDVLTVSGGVPAWAAPTGGGKVLQVVAATYSTSVTNATTSYADTGLTATITPTLATSKVLVLVNQAGIHKSSNNSNSACLMELQRGGTTIITEFAGLAGLTATDINNYVGSVSASYLDEPATTSATTYKTRFKNNTSAVQVGVNSSNSTSTIVLMEIGA